MSAAKPISYYLIPILRKRPPIYAVDEVFKAVCNKYNLTREQVMSKSRKAPILFARQLTMYLLRKKCNLSLPKIAKIFNRKDHSGVHTSIKVIQNYIDTNSLNKRDEILSF